LGFGIADLVFANQLKIDKEDKSQIPNPKSQIPMGDLEK
jgi:hypothetical protein